MKRPVPVWDLDLCSERTSNGSVMRRREAPGLFSAYWLMGEILADSLTRDGGVYVALKVETFNVLEGIKTCNRECKWCCWELIVACGGR